MDSRSPSPSAEREKDEGEILAIAIQRVVSALGGESNGKYVPGDSCHGCLKDLKKIWRLDDYDDDRNVARILWDTSVFVNDLIPILMTTAEKTVIACADLMTAMTWPIDLTQELQEMEDEDIHRSDYTVLLGAHAVYKRAMIQNPQTFEVLLKMVLPCLLKSAKERKPRDTQIISLVLHLFRNLAFIKSDQAEYISALSSTHVLELLLTIASNAQHNTILLDIFHLLLRGIKPHTLLPSTTGTKSALAKALNAEKMAEQKSARNSHTRHSRFGTTVVVRQHNAEFILRNQAAVNSKDPGALLDATKKALKKRVRKVDEEYEPLTHHASTVMREFGTRFIEACLNPFLASILKDIKSERPHITEKDNLRLLAVARWGLEFFLAFKKSKKWGFEYVAEVLERSWIVWVLKRMRMAIEDTPKQYTELKLGTDCLVQFFGVIDEMLSDPDSPDSYKEVAETLQYSLYYNGEILDFAFDNLKEWKEGGLMGFGFLESSVQLGYILMRMLERWGKNKGNVYVRKRARAKAKAKRRRQNEEEILDVEDVPEEKQDEQMIQEQMFTFEKYEQKFADEEIAQSLLAYLANFRNFGSADEMKWVVNLIHRQAIKAKAEGLFFKVSTMTLFKSIIAEERSFPKEQPYKDLTNIIDYLLKKFFKAAKADPLIFLEAFFPKNRGLWKQFSSWQPEPKSSRKKKDKNGDESDTNIVGEVQVKKGYSWSEQLGIAIACLVEKGQLSLVDWVKQILTMASTQRRRIIEEIDGADDADPSDLPDEEIRRSRTKVPSSEAMQKITDFYIPYIDDEQATAATKNPHLKLVFRLIKAHVEDESQDELTWYIPAAILPDELDSSLRVINQCLENPIDLGGRRASQLISKKTTRRRRRKAATDSEGDLPNDSDLEGHKEKRKKKKKEVQVYKSAQFIEDSDADPEKEEEFFARERVQREANERRAKEGLPVAAKPTGTKKRKKKSDGNGNASRKKRRPSEAPESGASSADSTSEDENGEGSTATAAGKPKAGKLKPKPRPKPRLKAKASAASTSPRENGEQLDDAQQLAASTNDTNGSRTLNQDGDFADDEEDGAVSRIPAKKPRKMVLSDDEDEG
ncbi:timeless-domain-containing protein [Sistotremastrum suecicum HHB10207 ss-3]|uniref:Timeless-domain-containing protein n=1 Tax=Sistotremastrum suecicum HHB10207 ss-3 TaxID=1314776 RepID=A0A166I239_9AGAM|nr:timeless-domain-containing protein [Sistotremastrum suecicum HHB10207 ss-3]